jgi:pimeloyl-ACP methyl ester carboxylesterase
MERDSDVQALSDVVLDSVLIDGHRIAYGRHGVGEPVVLVHGTPSYSYEWRAIVPALADAGYEVYLYDLLGYGASERPIDVDTSVGGQVPILEGLLDEWGLERAHVAGHDIGGAIGLRLALSHPDRVTSLTLLDTASYDSWPSETWREIIDSHLDAYVSMSDEEFREMLTRQLAMTVVDEETMTGETLEAYLAPHRGTFGRVSFFYHQVRHYDSRYTEEITPELQTLSLPVQILWGEADLWQPVEYAYRLADDIPDADLHVFEDAGHFLMEDTPDRVANQLLTFLDERQ